MGSQEEAIDLTEEKGVIDVTGDEPTGDEKTTGEEKRSTKKRKAPWKNKQCDGRKGGVRVVSGGDLLEASEWIAHQANCESKGARGVARSLFTKYPWCNVYKSRSEDSTPGTIELRKSPSSASGRTVVALYAQRSPGPARVGDSVADRLRWFENCLDELGRVMAEANARAVAMPYRIGCDSAGGDWSKYEPLLERFALSHSLDVVLYDKNDVARPPATVGVVRGGDLLRASADEWIAHQCNCVTSTAKGLSLYVFKAFPDADVYSARKNMSGRPDEPGDVRVVVDARSGRTVVALFAQRAPGKPKYSGDDSADCRLRWFDQCLERLGQAMRQKQATRLALPYNIGCGLAGGNWPRYKDSIDNFSRQFHIRVALYDKDRAASIPGGSSQ